MPIIPNMMPGTQLTWVQFCEVMPPRSIALDGFVQGVPAFDPEGPYRNFDHHAGDVPRSDLLCTAAQVLEAIRQGMLELFMPTGEEDICVFMNDCDPDVCLAWYAILHYGIVRDRVNPAVNRLFGHVQDMDKLSGLVDVPRDLPIVGQSAWIFQPYWEFRMSGAIDRKDARAYMSVLQDVTERVHDFVAGRGQTLRINDAYDQIGGGSGWVMVREIGPHARMRMARRGVRAFVSARQREDGRWVYTICRASPYVFWFPVPQIAERLNLDEDEADRFGGGDIVCGNARGNGSARDPSQMAEAINNFLAERELCAP